MAKFRNKATGYVVDVDEEIRTEGWIMFHGEHGDAQLPAADFERFFEPVPEFDEAPTS